MDKAILRLVYEFNGYGICLYVLITVAFAAILSMVIGFERQLQGEPAGIKVHVLVAIGSALLMTISIWAIRIADGSIVIKDGGMSPAESSNEISYDTSRIAAAVITGIGFLGAGVIIKDKLSVHGLSAAATLWICAAIGMACGAGFILEAIVATAVTLAFILLIGTVINKINRYSPYIKITCDNKFPALEKCKTVADNNKIIVKHMRILNVDDKETTVVFQLAYRTTENKVKYLANQFECFEEISNVFVNYRPDKRDKEYWK